MDKYAPIGIFDSGVGGLTVLQALREELPEEHFVYLGDMARLPYGTKSPETIALYAEQVTKHLLKEDIKMLVIACNTASALGMDRIKECFPDLPCIGVVEPGSEAAIDASKSKSHVVLATESTVRSDAYAKAIKAKDAEAKVQSIPCNLLVGLVEEGWFETDVAVAILQRYLEQIALDDFDTIVLGCTHFPLLLKSLKKVLKPSISIVDSAKMTAKAVKRYLKRHDLEKSENRFLLGESNRESIPDSNRESIRANDSLGAVRYLVTDSQDRFLRIAKAFMVETDDGEVELVDL